MLGLRAGLLVFLSPCFAQTISCSSLLCARDCSCSVDVFDQACNEYSFPCGWSRVKGGCLERTAEAIAQNDIPRTNEEEWNTNPCSMPPAAPPLPPPSPPPPSPPPSVDVACSDTGLAMTMAGLGQGCDAACGDIGLSCVALPNPHTVTNDCIDALAIANGLQTCKSTKKNTLYAEAMIAES